MSSSSSQYLPSESSDFNWRSSVNDFPSSEHLNKGARPIFSKQNVLTNVNMKYFIPEYIREKFHQPIAPKQCTIKAICKAEKTEPFYTFILSWYKNEAHMMDYCSGDGTTSRRTLSSNVTSRTELRKQQQHRRSMKDLEPTVEIIPAAEQMRLCDGPCGKMRSIKELFLHGQCDHAICRFCTNNAPMIKNVDGSIGCCNPECFEINLTALCPDPVLRRKYLQKIVNGRKKVELLKRSHKKNGHLRKQLRRKKEKEQLSSSLLTPSSVMSSASTSQVSSVNRSSEMTRNLKELTVIKVVIFEKGPLETICRQEIINEIVSTETLYRALQLILGQRRKLRNCRIFISYMVGNDDHSKLQEIDLKKYGDKKLTSFPTNNGMLSFVIDCTNNLNY